MCRYVSICTSKMVEALSTQVFIEDPLSPGTAALSMRNDLWELAVTWLLNQETHSSGRQVEREQKNKHRR